MQYRGLITNFSITSVFIRHGCNNTSCPLTLLSDSKQQIKVHEMLWLCCCKKLTKKMNSRKFGALLAASIVPTLVVQSQCHYAVNSMQ